MRCYGFAGISQVLAFALLGAFVTFVPLMGTFSRSSHDFARLCELALLQFLVTLFVLSRRNIFKYGNENLTTFFIVGFFSFGLISCSLAFDFFVALREWLIFVGLFVLVLVVRGFRSDAWVMWAKLVIFASIVYLVFLVFLYWVVLYQGHPVNTWDLIAGYDNPRFLNHVQVVVLPLLVGAFLSPLVEGYSRVWRWLAAAAMIGQFAVMAMSYGRSAMVSILLATFLVWALIGPKFWLYVRATVLAGTFGVVFYLAFFRFMPDILGRVVVGGVPETAQLVSDHSRFYLWEIGFNHFLENPFVGIGPMHYAHHVNRAGAHPHNLYIQLAAEWGGLAFLFFALWVAHFFCGVLVRLRGGTIQLPLQLSAVFACVAVAIDAFFSGNMVMPLSQVWIALAVGMALWSDDNTTEAHESASPKSRLLSMTASIVMVLVMAYALILGVREFSQAVPAFSPTQPGQDNVGTLDRPRFWRQGWF